MLPSEPYAFDTNITFFTLANTTLSIMVCVFEASATLLTLLRSVKALRTGVDKSISSKRHTLYYLVIQQSVFLVYLWLHNG